VSAGATEINMAIVDLEVAHAVSPNDREVTALLRDLKVGRRRQKEVDRRTFSGLFERGAVIVGEVGEVTKETLNSNEGPHNEGVGRFETRRDLVEYIQLLEAKLQEAKDDENEEEELLLAAKVKETQSLLENIDAELQKRRTSRTGMCCLLGSLKNHLIPKHCSSCLLQTGAILHWR
jgi:hypothetical protein